MLIVLHRIFPPWGFRHIIRLGIYSLEQIFRNVAILNRLSRVNCFLFVKSIGPIDHLLLVEGVPSRHRILNLRVRLVSRERLTQKFIVLHFDFLNQLPLGRLGRWLRPYHCFLEWVVVDLLLAHFEHRKLRLLYLVAQISIVPDGRTPFRVDGRNMVWLVQRLRILHQTTAVVLLLIHELVVFGNEIANQP